MGLPSFTDLLAGLSMQALGRGAQALPEVAATIDSTSGTTRIALEVLDAIGGIHGVAWAQDRAARERGSAARAGLESTFGVAASDFTGDFEPRAVSVMEFFEGMSHAEIVEFVEAMKPSRMRESVEGWGRAQVLLDDNLEVFRTAIASVFTEHWTGTTASAAGRGVADYSASLTQLTNALALVTNSLGYASAGIEQVKQRLPDPPQSTWSHALRAGIAGGLTTLPTGTLSFRVNDLFHAEEEARATAVRIMQEDYAPTVTTADSRVPVLPPAFDPTADGSAGSVGYPGAGSGPGSSGVGRGSGSGSDGSSVSTYAPGGNLGDNMSGEPSSSAAAGPGSTGTDMQNAFGAPASQPSGSEAQDAARTTAASADPRSAVPASTTGWPGSPSPGSAGTVSGGSGTGSPGVGSPGSGLSGSGSPGAVPPGFVSGPAAATPASGAAPGAARGVGRAAAMPMGMMPPHAGKGDEEKRSVPGYLVTEEHGNELIGDMPATTPPVLGA